MTKPVAYRLDFFLRLLMNNTESPIKLNATNADTTAIGTMTPILFPPPAALPLPGVRLSFADGVLDLPALGLTGLVEDPDAFGEGKPGELLGGFGKREGGEGGVGGLMDGT